jgi:hypothetical protein
MSVTFRPRECATIQGPYGPEPEYWTNFSNGNAARMLDVAGLPNDCCGECALADLPSVAQRLIRALNQREIYSCEATVLQHPGPQRCGVIDCGTTEERERERIHGLLRVVNACITLQMDLTWD